VNGSTSPCDDIRVATCSSFLFSFGNPAFRTWHQRLLERSNAIITACLLARDGDLSTEEASKRGWDAAAGILEANDDDPSIQQVSCYLHDAFGHAVRLDYGTGHECSFLVFLLVLSKVKCLGETPSLTTLGAATLSIFDQYLQVTRRLQTDYRLEPAGSHGVWGLDDYHCLPFYFGACQLQAKGVDIHEQLTHPNCITDEGILKDYGDSFLYLSCIRYIRQLKKGAPFYESSPMLYDISQTVPIWDKVARGMIRLFEGEVLDKRVVVQHFVFSRYFPATWNPSQAERTAPTQNFRTPVPEGGAAGIPVTRAPWATNNSAGAGPTPPTRAPWATNTNNANADMSPTRAPWAKQS
jgi:serine/threonine-protein phosphatase 2A activator